MALDGGGVEAGQLGDRELGGGLAEHLGGGHPAGAHHQGHVVGVDPGQLAQPGGGVAGEGVGVGGRVAHGRDSSARRGCRGQAAASSARPWQRGQDRGGGGEERDDVLDRAADDAVDPAHGDPAGLGQGDPAVRRAGLVAQGVEDRGRARGCCWR